MKVSLFIITILVVQCYSAPFSIAFSWPQKNEGNQETGDSQETAQPPATWNGGNNRGANPPLATRNRRQAEDVPVQASYDASADTSDTTEAAQTYQEGVQAQASQHSGYEVQSSSSAQSAGANVETGQQEHHEQQHSQPEVQRPPQHSSPAQEPPTYQSPAQEPPRYQSPVQNQEPPRYESLAPQPPQSPDAGHNVNANSGHQSAPNPARNEIEKDEPKKPVNADDELRSAIPDRPLKGGLFGPIMTMYNDVRKSISVIDCIGETLHNFAALIGIC